MVTPGGTYARAMSHSLPTCETTFCRLAPDAGVVLCWRDSRQRLRPYAVSVRVLDRGPNGIIDDHTIRHRLESLHVGDDGDLIHWTSRLRLWWEGVKLSKDAHTVGRLVLQ